jgi:hypothetical protein
MKAHHYLSGHLQQEQGRQRSLSHLHCDHRFRTVVRWFRRLCLLVPANWIIIIYFYRFRPLHLHCDHRFRTAVRWFRQLCLLVPANWIIIIYFCRFRPAYWGKSAVSRARSACETAYGESYIHRSAKRVYMVAQKNWEHDRLCWLDCGCILLTVGTTE